jgi:hypothetical protein
MSAITPDAKIEMIERSFQCHLQGLLGLIPIVGLPFVVLAAVRAAQVWRMSAGQWNPAQRYLYWAEQLAWLGLALAFIEVTVAGMIIASN